MRQYSFLWIPSALVVALLLLPISAAARVVFDPADPAFQGAVTVGFDSAAIADDTLVHEFASNGVSFRLESLSNVALDAGGNALRSFGFAVAGPALVVTVNPPVEALGFVGTELDGCPGATIVGSFAEQVGVAPPCTPAAFFGAADLGAIASADVSRPGSVWLLESIVFVPPGVVPPGSADVAVTKTESGEVWRVAGNGEPLSYSVVIENVGPDPAPDARITDFFPPGVFQSFDYTGNGAVAYDPATDVATTTEPLLASGASLVFSPHGLIPGRSGFSCDSLLTNVALVGSDALDPDLANNVAVAITAFDANAVRGDAEICDDGIDNDCNGRFDCGDPACHCRPSLPGGDGGTECWGGLEQVPLPDGTTAIVSGLCDGSEIRQRPAPEHQCHVDRGACGGVSLPAFCCDARTASDPSAENLAQLASCDVGVPGCAPRDPNRKESDPPVNAAGYAYIDAGQRIAYTIHYENVGDADAHDVVVIDPLGGDLDLATLAIEDGGVFDAATRTIQWRDAVVPPATPRRVRFAANVRADAEPATRIRNVATIVFPDAVPPTRIDTNFVEHAVLDPALPVAAELRVIGCQESTPGSGAWTARLVNEGLGFAYDVEASIDAPPAAVAVADGSARFSHPDDPEPAVLATVIPSAVTESDDPVHFTSETPADPCGALRWRIRWQNLRGDAFESVVQALPDADADAVADARDNCPAVGNSNQADADGDGAGDACDAPPPVGLELAAHAMRLPGSKAWKVILRWPRFPDRTTHCDVLRRAGDGVAQSVAQNLRGAAGKWGDRDVAADTTYAYTLVCRSTGAGLVASNEASATTSGAGTPPPPLPPHPKLACGLLGLGALAPHAAAAAPEGPRCVRVIRSLGAAACSRSRSERGCSRGPARRRSCASCPDGESK